MPSRRAVIVSSWEPWASAMSKRRGRAHERSALSRLRSERPFPARERPPWRPRTVGLDPVQLEELERLGVVARGDLDLGSALAEQREQRPEDEHVRRRGDVDPDPHADTPARTAPNESA